MKRYLTGLLILLPCLLLMSNIVLGSDNTITMSTTTSTENSGLLNILLPEFTSETGIQVKVIAKGTGSAIRWNGR